MTPTHPDNTSAHSASATPRVPRSQSVAESKALNLACAQFNAGEFFACHETLEPLWLAANGTERTYWHALIQAAVALHHYQRGNLKGASSVYRRAAEKLSVLPFGFGAIDTEALTEALHSFFTNASADEKQFYPILKMR